MLAAAEEHGSLKGAFCDARDAQTVGGKVVVDAAPVDASTLQRELLGMLGEVAETAETKNKALIQLFFRLVQREFSGAAFQVRVEAGNSSTALIPR